MSAISRWVTAFTPSLRDAALAGPMRTTERTELLMRIVAAELRPHLEELSG